MGYISTWEMLFFSGSDFIVYLELLVAETSWNVCESHSVCASLFLLVVFFSSSFFSLLLLHLCRIVIFTFNVPALRSPHHHFSVLWLLYNSFWFSTHSIRFYFGVSFFCRNIFVCFSFHHPTIWTIFVLFFLAHSEKKGRRLLCVCKEWMFKTKAEHRRPTKSSEMYESDRMYCCLSVFKRVPSI